MDGQDSSSRRDGRRDAEDRRRRHHHSDQRDSRSRSPRRHHSRREHSRSPSRRHHHHRHREAAAPTQQQLPFSARPLDKADLQAFAPLFAEYLSLQKQRDMHAMDDREVRGRWKSFMGKWNRGELAEGWYDPETFARLAGEDAGERRARQGDAVSAVGGDGQAAREGAIEAEEQQEEEEDDDYGPVLPGKTRSPSSRHGPGIPTIQDLALRAEDAALSRLAATTALQTARQADRALQKSRLDDLTPRAEAGTHERRLENRALLNEKLKGFRDRSPGPDAVPEGELMGGGDGVEEFRREKEREARKRSEREVRREEIARAKREEMEERRRAWREREEGTMGMLKELARQRFG